MATHPDPPRRVESEAPSALDRIAHALSWVWLALIVLIVLSVVLRFVFDRNLVQIEELEWHLYAIGFLVGIVACTEHDRHVRVDVLRERMRGRTRHWVDLYGTLLLQIPFLALLLASSIPFALDSLVTEERSAAAGGLPYRFILKSVLPLAMLLLLAATLRRLGRTWSALFAARTSEEEG